MKPKPLKQAMEATQDEPVEEQVKAVEAAMETAAPAPTPANSAQPKS
jgi:hypothetical protein